MKVTNANGLTMPMAAMKAPITERPSYRHKMYLDLLEDGKWLVSEHNTSIGLFDNLAEAAAFYLSSDDLNKSLDKILPFVAKAINEHYEAQ